jgi:hypothetical protein
VDEYATDSLAYARWILPEGRCPELGSFLAPSGTHAAGDPPLRIGSDDEPSATGPSALEDDDIAEFSDASDDGDDAFGRDAIRKRPQARLSLELAPAGSASTQAPGPATSPASSPDGPFRRR